MSDDTPAPTEARPSTPNSRHNRTVILGVNERIGTLVRLLRAQGRELVVVSANAKRFARDLSDVEVIHGDFIDRRNIKRARIQDAEAVIILAETVNKKPRDADARSVVATLAVEAAFPEVRTVVEALSEDTAYHLRNAGVDEIIVSGELTADILAFSTTHPDYGNHLEVLLRFAHQNRIVTAPVRERLVGKKFAEANLTMIRERKILLGVRPEGRADRESLDPDRTLRDKDILVYIDIL